MRSPPPTRLRRAPPTAAATPHGISSSLDEEIDRVQSRFQHAMPLLGVLLLPAAVFQAALEPKRGLIYVVFALFGIALPRLLDDGRATRVGTLLVALVPVLGSAVIQLTRGPFVAGTSFLVPILFCACLGISAFHFRASHTLLLGGLASLFYVADYAFLIRPALTPAQLENPLDWASQATRVAFMLAFTGAAARAATLAKAMFFRAAASARAHDLFAKYRLERLLGRGGMGEVWGATYCPEGGFMRPVAVKMIQGRLAQDEAFVAAFRREAELCARLQHKNIVQVLDFGREADRWFLAMEYVDGLTLSALVRRLRTRSRALSPPIAMYVAKEILEGIAYAHRDATDLDGRPLCVVHRDLAPANVLVSRTGQVKVTDFGVACARGSKAAPGAFSGVVGHLGYLSPEQARGAPVDERADLYAVGVMLWEMLTGRRLFPGRTEAALRADAKADGSADPPAAPSAAAPGIGAGPWDAIVLRALARDPTERFPTARALADALARALDEVGWPRERALASLVEEMLSCRPSHTALAVEPLGASTSPSTAPPSSLSTIEALEDTHADPRARPLEELSTLLGPAEVHAGATRPGRRSRAA